MPIPKDQLGRMGKNPFSHLDAESILVGKSLYDEIIQIARSVAHIEQNHIKKHFEQRQWDTSGQMIRVFDDGKFEFDAFKQSVAIEIELSMHDSTFKDYFKFLTAHSSGKKDAGVLLVRTRATDNAQPTFSLACSDVRRFKEILTVPILVVGVPLRL